MGFTQLPDVHEEYTNLQLLKQESQWIYHFFSPSQAILVLFSLTSSVYFWATKKIQLSKFYFVWVLFGFIAVTHVILFRTGAWRHDYWLYYFLPFFSWGIAMGISLLEKIINNRGQVIIYIIYVLALILAIYQTQPFFWALQNLVEK